MNIKKFFCNFIKFEETNIERLHRDWLDVRNGKNDYLTHGSVCVPYSRNNDFELIAKLARDIKRDREECQKD